MGLGCRDACRCLISGLGVIRAGGPESKGPIKKAVEEYGLWVSLHEQGALIGKLVMILGTPEYTSLTYLSWFVSHYSAGIGHPSILARTLDEGPEHLLGKLCFSLS